MTNLVQLHDAEAEALAFAKERLVEYRDGFPPENNRGFARGMLRHYALLHPFNMSCLRDGARNGWGDAHDVLVRLIAEHHDQGRPLPPQLATYSIDTDNPYLPPRPTGPNKANQVARKIVIVSIIDELVHQFGLRAVRNRQSRSPAQRPSACSVLAKALADEPHPLSERAIERIWEDFRDFAFAQRDRFNRMTAELKNLPGL